MILRLGRPEDRELLRRGFEKLSPESRYRRFLSAKSALSEAELDYLTKIDQLHHVAIAAVEEHDGQQAGLGVARCVRLPDREDTAEAAVAVIDDAQGVGLGSLLLQRLVAAARERGIAHFSGNVLGDNRAMHDLFRTISDRVHSSVEDGVAHVEIDLPEVEPEQPADDPPREHPSYQILRKAAKGLVRLRRSRQLSQGE